MDRTISRVAILLLAVLLGACAPATTPGPSGPSSRPVGTGPGQATPATGASADASTAVVQATPIPSTSDPTIGKAADDGARIIRVDAIGKRIRDLAINSPSVGVVHVRLLIPARFDARPSARWPVLYLLHGAEGSATDWTSMTDVEKLSATADLLIVMPDAGASGWYSDWWNHGAGGPPMWERFHVVELRQLLERNWRAGTRRALAGLSMGGLGAMDYAARNPGTFVAAASFSGALDPLGAAVDTGSDATWGDPNAQADIWKAHDPVELAPALKGLTLYVSYGDGTPGPFDDDAVPAGDLEGWIAVQDATFVARLRELGIPVTVDAYGPGTHTWPYWERALHRAWPLLLKALGLKG